MKNLLGLLLLGAACVVLSLSTTGCQKPKDKDKDKAKGGTPPADTKSLVLKATPESVEVEADKKASVDVTVTRTKVDDEVKLTIAASDGVDAPKETTIPKDKDKTTITFSATKNGDLTINGAAGDVKAGEIKVKVTFKAAEVKKPKVDPDPEVKPGTISLKAEDLKVKVDDKAAKLKVTATRDKADDAIVLKVASDAKGVEFKGATIAKGENEGVIEVTVSADAKAGDYDVTITGTSGKHKVADGKAKLKITDK